MGATKKTRKDGQTKTGRMTKPEKPFPAETEAGILDGMDLAIESPVIVQELHLKNHVWFVKFQLKDTIESTHSYYRVSMLFDSKPYEDRIQQIRSNVEAGMFADDPVEQKNAEKSIDRIREEMQKQAARCPDINFTASVTEVKYAGDGTRIQAIIQGNDAAVVNDISKNRVALRQHYKIRLDPASA